MKIKGNSKALPFSNLIKETTIIYATKMLEYYLSLSAYYFYTYFLLLFPLGKKGTGNFNTASSGRKTNTASYF